jgi:hypothetical protein
VRGMAVHVRGMAVHVRGMAVHVRGMAVHVRGIAIPVDIADAVITCFVHACNLHVPHSLSVLFFLVSRSCTTIILIGNCAYLLTCMCAKHMGRMTFTCKTWAVDKTVYNNYILSIILHA